MINFLKYKKIYFLVSAMLIGFSLISLGLFGLTLGIDFRGGSELHIKFIEITPNIVEVRAATEKKEVTKKAPEIIIQEIGEEGNAFLIRIGEKDNVTAKEQKQIIASSLKNIGEIEIKKFTSISGVVGKEIKSTVIIVVILAILLVIFYIAFAFRKVSKPLSSWYYGIISFLTLSHNILIILGLLALLGHLYDVTITIPIVAGLLIIWGYSINDNVVVFDRIRENLFKEKEKSIEKYNDIINKSLNQTVTRSINTSLSTLLAIIFILFVGGEALKYLILILLVGVVVGTYASIFLASPLLVIWLNKKLKSKNIKVN